MVNPAFLLPLAILHAHGGPSLGERCNIGGILDKVGNNGTAKITTGNLSFVISSNFRVVILVIYIMFIMSKVALCYIFSSGAKLPCV